MHSEPTSHRVDSPGLQDGNHKDESYLNLISEIVVSVIVQWLILTGCSRHPGMVTCHAKCNIIDTYIHIKVSMATTNK